MQDHQVDRDGEGRDFIERVRRTEYMIGMTLSVEAEEAAEGMRRKLNNALRLLSDDLYSTRTHFVLELIQNADDNTYADGTSPEIHLALSPSALKIWNNEQGFTEANVRALCSVGESTKSKKVGFIGEKGIGFKSVFQVSNAPQIHSNGFHFRFDMSNPEEHLGYVVPHWIEPNASIAADGTTIVLPAKTGESFTDAVLSELDARLLLFLRKLTRIELSTPSGAVTMRRLDEDGLVTLQTDRRMQASEVVSSSQRYLRVSASVSMTDAVDEKRPAVVDSEMILAFPVDDADKALAAPDCATFAFLPIRTFGFRFCVQADFLLSSAREDIQTARAWNAALRDAIAPAFVASLEQFRSRPELARTYLKFLPEKQEITHSFFTPVGPQMIAALAQTECILCATGQWRKPTDVMTAPTAFQRLVPADQAWQMFGKDYPAPDLDVEPDTLKKLGCTPLFVADVVRLFTDHGDWVMEQGRVWLAQLFRYIATINRQYLRDAGIQEAACLPLSDGTLQSPSARTVFFPLARGTKFGFEQQLRILDEAFIDAVEDQDKANIYGLLHDLGVRTPEPYALIRDEILPAHLGQRWQQAGLAALMGHVHYVKVKLDEYLGEAARHGQPEASAMETLSKGLRFKTKRNEGTSWWFKHAADVYPSHEYQPDFDIETLLASDLEPERLVSADYLPRDLMKRDPQDRETVLADWRKFFFRLGMNASPRLTEGTNAACSTELAILLASESSTIRRQTLECLDRHWDRYSRHATYAVLGRPATRYYTTFATTLRSTTAPTRQRRSAALQDTYYPTDIVRDVFGSSPTYIDAELRNEEFLEICGIVHRVDASACIKRLKQIKAADKPSAAQVRPLYQHLEQIFDRNAASVLDAFKEHALILSRSIESPWRRPDEVVWTSPGEFLNLHYPALHAQYTALHGFFVRKLGVPYEVSIAAAVRALPSIPTAGLTADAQATEALRIYVRASRELAAEPSAPAPAWLADFATLPVFLNHRGEMVALDDSLYADDQPTTSALFADQEGISFLAVPPTRLPQIRVLLEAVKVPLLSESLDIAPQSSGGERPNTTFTTRVRERYRYIARLVYAQSHTVFERAKEAGLWRRLSQLSVSDVEALTIGTTLQGITATTQGEVVISGDVALVRTGTKGVADRLAREICVMLKAPLALADGVCRILRDQDIAEVEEYLDVREIPALPDDELSQLTLEQLRLVPEPDDWSEPAEDCDTTDSVQASASPPEEPVTTSTGGTSNVPRLASTPISNGTMPPSTQSPLSPNEVVTAPTRQAPADDPASEANITGALPPVATGQSGSSRVEAHNQNRLGSSGATSPSLRSAGGKRRSTVRYRGGRISNQSDTSHRLLSYVELATGNSEPPDNAEKVDRAADRDATAQAAVKYFLETQKTKWLTLEEMPPYNKGFDVRGISLDGGEHFIEIKGQSATWTSAGIALTPSELLCAADKRERYWLCIVEHAIHPGRQILHLVNNPFGKAEQFRFDSGWKATATRETGTAPLVPAAGLRINIQDLGRGTILSVKKAGAAFYKIHVHLADGRQVFKVFEPARMQISQED